jgi:hypothetical protein
MSHMINSYEWKRMLVRSKDRWASDRICKLQGASRGLYTCDSGERPLVNSCRDGNDP